MMRRMMLASAGIRRYGSPSSFSTILLSYHRSHEPKFVACSINEFLQPDWRNNQRNKFSSFSSTHWSSNGLRNSRSFFYQNGVSVRSVAPPSRNFSATGDPSSPLSVALYQYSICPFCNRVKTVLDYIGSDALSVQHVEVNPLTKSEIQPWKKVYRKVPIATVNQEAIFGSDEIIQSILAQPIVRISLEERWRKAAFSSPTTMTWDQFTSSSEWTEYATKELAVWLYPNMCRTWSDSYRAFDYIHEKPYSSLQRFLIQNVGSLAMYFAANKIKKKHNVSDEQQALQDVLAKLETELERLNPSGSSHYHFLSQGVHPNLGDLSVYGTLRAIQNLPIYQKIITDRGGPILEWSRRMLKEIPNLSK